LLGFLSLLLLASLLFLFTVLVVAHDLTTLRTEGWSFIKSKVAAAPSFNFDTFNVDFFDDLQVPRAVHFIYLIVIVAIGVLGC